MNSAPTALFDSYEQDFKQFIGTIRKRLNDVSAAGSDNDQRDAALRRVDMELDEADEMVSQMEIELQGIPQLHRAPYHTRLQAAKGDLAGFKKMLAEQKSQRLRQAALSSTSNGVASISDDPYASTSDRARLLAGTAMLEDGTRRLQESHRIALETENQGADILMNLRGQREQIENARDTLHTADSSIDRASVTLKKMIRRMYKERVITAAIIIFLVLLIGVIVWEKLS